MISRAGVLGCVVGVMLAAVPGVAEAVPTATFGKCGPTAAPNARCGTVAVPLDRSKPASPTLPIAFQLTPHTDPGPAVSMIVISNGGPGVSNLLSDPIWRDRLAGALKTHDLIAIDHRGIGQSAAIDCPALQHVKGNQLDAARACGTSLGAASDRYGSGDVADDVDDVRAALGVDKVDYYGVSYGGVDVRAYAYRHADHLRSAILDSPDFSTDDAFFRTLPGAMAKIAVRVCKRSPACAAGEKQPAVALRQLIARVFAKPVVGTGYDASGKPHQLKVDEAAVLGILYDNYFADPAFLNQGEIFAAARALQTGDKTPLLRLAAESNAPGRLRGRRRRAVGRRRLRRLLFRQRVPLGQVRAGGDAQGAVRGRRQGRAALRDRAVLGGGVDRLHRFAAGAADPGRRRVHLVAGADPPRASVPARPALPGERARAAVRRRPGLPRRRRRAHAASLVPGRHAVRDRRQRRSRHDALEPLRGGHRGAVPEHGEPGGHELRG